MLIRVPATSANLGPGFDCVGMALNLYNYIEFEVLEKYNDLSIDIKGEGDKNLKKDNTNLVYQAFSKVFLDLGKPIPGIKFSLKNNIPLSRGLGSSSAAIIGGLMAANYLLDNILDESQLLDLAAGFEGHPDNIAPALLGGIVICTVNGQKIIYKKMNPPKTLSCSLLIPDYELSTQKAREILPTSIPLKDAVFNIGRMAFFVHAINSGDLELLKLAIDDKLHQPYRKQLIPGLSDVFKKAKELNILGIAISGAGPSIIVFHKKEETDNLPQLLDVIGQYGINSRLINLEPVEEGAKILD
ncbi:MAG: homoserine kinase [Clostridia bacterium]|nr:homoserine kinase [Clostridia bacterium]MDN5322872.1 homoserine kinase [Clostridia bacterium]